jgi:Ca2+-binding RTX toxin-like protein
MTLTLMDGPSDLREYASADPDAGGTARDKPIFTPEEVADQITRSGQNWYLNNYGALDDGVLNFAFWASYEDLANSYYVNSDGTIAFNEAYYEDDFSIFSEVQKDMARDAIGLWDDLIDITFAETGTDEGDLNYGNTYTGGAQAYAYLPFGDIYDSFYEQFGFEEAGHLGGDVWIDGFVASNFFPTEASYYAFTTMIHETGHALGLSHPGDYNATAGVPLSYDLATYYQDSLQYSIMSYWDAYETGAQYIDFTLLNFAYPATPQVHDIAAIQSIYGADLTTRTGDTVYGFNSTADRAVYDFDVNTRPVVSIWDAGGNDTLDFSGWATPSIIDLNEGAFSSGGGTIEFLTLEEVNANRAALGFALRDQATFDFYQELIEEQGLTNGLFKDNISIAYGTVIENAVGGSGNDLIIANQVANHIDGGLGNDIVSYQTATSGVTVSLGVIGGTAGGATGDILLSIEGVTGSAFNDTLIGDNGDNVIDGGKGGADTLIGGAGIDTLSYASATSAVTVNLSTGKAAGGAAGDEYVGFENLTGSDFADTLAGDSKSNVLTGGKGDDSLSGGNGKDILIGGEGADRLVGGKGADIFRFFDLDVDGSRDLLVDFTNDLDILDLSGIDANTNTAADDAFVRIGKSAFSGHAGELRLVSGILYGDVDGDKLADFSIDLGITVHLYNGDVIL